MPATQQTGRIHRTLLAIIAVAAGLWLLRATAAVTLPLAFAAFIAVLVGPLQLRLARHSGYGAAFGLTMLGVTATFGLFVAGLWLCAEQLADGAERYRDAWETIRHQGEAWASSVGIEPGSSGDDSGGLGKKLFEKGAKGLGGALSGFILCSAFLALGLWEARDWRSKLTSLSGERGAGLAGNVSKNFRRYFGTRTLTSALTGVLSGLFTWAMGLDFPLVWGIASFLLNYIPTLGSVVAIVPPALLAYVQFDAAWAPLAVVGGLGAIQFLLGSVIDPRLQARFVNVSSLIVLVSIALWGWVWGIAGALLGVPIAIVVILTANEHGATRWIGTLLGDESSGDDQRSARDGERP